MEIYVINEMHAIWKNGDYYCPFCNEKIKCKKPSDYAEKNEIHPCELCGKRIVWQPDWYLSDLRD